MSARPWRDKPFRDALRTEIASAGPNHKALRVVAAALIQRAATGDINAIRELADRTDGKVAQAIVGDREHDPVQIQGIAWLGDQTIHDITPNNNGHVTEQPRSQAQITGPRPAPLTIELPGQRKRDWAREHMRKKRAEAKAAREAARDTSALPHGDGE